MMFDVNSGNGRLYRIDGDGVLKVGDFGLSEDVYRTGYCRLDKGSSGVRLPSNGWPRRAFMMESSMRRLM